MVEVAVMGIVNATPDSFSDGGQFFSSDAAIAHGLQLHRDGAAWVDVGGESTRPGADPVCVEDEIARTAPVIRALAAEGVRVSIDTMKAEVADAAVAAGAAMVNDVSAMRDPAMPGLVAQRKVDICLMHMQGEPRTMQANPVYADVVAEVEEFLLGRARIAEAAGIDRGQILLDPGIGFGKTLDHNLALLGATARLAALPYGLLIGVSRKSFIGRILADENMVRPVGDRGFGTVAAELIAAREGAKIIRTHDVKALRDAIRVTNCIAY